MIREIFLATLALAMVNTALANNDDGVRVQYSGSPELPDGIAFEQFLALVGTAGHEHDMALEHVAKALGITLDKTGRRLAQQRADFFIAIRRQMLDEHAAMHHRVLCAAGYRDRDVDEILNALNDVDDLREIVAAKYYRLSLGSLTQTERSRFGDYLQQRKLSITYVKTDARLKRTDIGSLAAGIDTRCNDMEAQQ